MDLVYNQETSLNPKESKERFRFPRRKTWVSFIEGLIFLVGAISQLS